MKTSKMKTSIMDLTTTVRLEQDKESGNWTATAYAPSGKGTIKVKACDWSRRLAVKRARAAIIKTLLQGGSK
jgi:hypothetical protein